jgi:AcrR family transcriptional regulator
VGGRLGSTRATRRRIIAAATTLLLSEGYHAMSVSALARAAGVSPQTVYNAIGGKADVLKLVHDVLLAGDEEPVPMVDRPEFRAMSDSPDRQAFIAAYARLCGLIYERVGPLLGTVLAQGAGSDAGLASFVDSTEAERRTDQSMVLAALEAVHGLPDGFRRDLFLDEVWCLTAPEIYDRLVRRSGWSHEDYVGWLADVLVAAFERTSVG